MLVSPKETVEVKQQRVEEQKKVVDRCMKRVNLARRELEGQMLNLQTELAVAEEDLREELVTFGERRAELVRAETVREMTLKFMEENRVRTSQTQRSYWRRYRDVREAEPRRSRSPADGGERRVLLRSPTQRRTVREVKDSRESEGGEPRGRTSWDRPSGGPRCGTAASSRGGE